MPKSQEKQNPNSRIYDLKEDIHKFFSQFSILNLCSEMYVLKEQFIHNFFFQFQILNLCFEMYFLREQFIHKFFFPISDFKLMFWSAHKFFFPIQYLKLMLWYVFFEGAIYAQIFLAIQYSKLVSSIYKLGVWAKNVEMVSLRVFKL